MSKLVLDDQTRSKLTKLGQQVDLLGEDGTPLGVYFSREAYLRLLYDLEKAAPRDQAPGQAWQDYKANGGLTTEQVLAFLRSLDDKGNGAS